MPRRPSELDTRAGRLRFVRKRKYANASDAARAMGVKIATYLGHENGSREFDDDAARYSAFFGVSIDWLLERRGAEPGTDDLYDRIQELAPEQHERALDFIEYLKTRKT